jgi:predicted MFS family arabinose efflux permease
MFIQMNLFSSINVELVKEFHFNAQQLSYLFAFFSYGSLIFLFPAGIMLDRLSVCKLLFINFAISIIATYAFSVVSSFWAMKVLRLIIGCTGAFSFLTSVKLASRWLEHRHIALAVGIVVTIGMISGIIAQTPLTIVTQQLGWRRAIQLVTLLGIFLTILQLIIVRDEPKGLKKFEIKEHTKLKKMGFWHSLSATITNKQNWLSGLYISLVNLPLFIFGGIWGVPYLTHAHHFTQIEATEITSMIFIGMIIGSPLTGLISDRIGLCTLRARESEAKESSLR